MNREELLKSAKPILFNTEMVRAILDGRKTVTRRVIKPQTVTHNTKEGLKEESLNDFFANNRVNLKLLCEACAPYKKGDILYVRETWLKTDCLGLQNGYLYKANDKQNAVVFDSTGITERWKPSIHMPKEAARIFLKVNDVRIERLQEITTLQALKEGFQSAYHFNVLWDKTIKTDAHLYDWRANPWVWVYEFERIYKNA